MTGAVLGCEHLPALPAPRVLAFDESIVVRGYSWRDMQEYAQLALLRRQPWWRKLLKRIAR